jgi:hypothetical protein
MSGDRLGSWLSLLCVALCLGPPLAVALEGLGAPPAAALTATLAAIALLAVGWRRIPPLPLALARRHPAAAALWILVLAAAVFGGVRASLYARDATQPRHSVDPGDAFRVEHCCLTAYAEAARFAAEGVDNPYARDLYRPGGEPRRLGPLTVDPFHYPPPFLLLPGAVRAVAPDFFDTRRVWFGLQALVLGAALLGLARWVGGEEGRRVALGAALVWALPSTFLGLQFGNFQLTAIPMALAGCWLGWSASRPRAGGALLAFAALGKVFPCLLALHVLGGRRWRFVAWLTAWGAAFALLTLALYGWAPFDGFFRHELPRLASGAAFPQTEESSGILVNQSFYGITTKLRALGLDALDAAAGKRLSQLYALLVAAAAVAAGRRLAREGEAVDGRERLRRAVTWLAILNLASFAGPFVGGGYGMWGTLWLIVLLWAQAGSRVARWSWLAALLPVAAPIFVLPSPADRAALTTGLLLLALVAPLASLALNAAALRLARRPAPAG